jgi:ribosomal protein L22
MADSDKPKTPRRRAAAGAAADAASSSPAEKTAAPRARAAAKKPAADKATEATSARTHATAKKADEAPAKPARARAAAKKPAAEPAAAAAAAVVEVEKPAKARPRARRGAAAKESAKPIPATAPAPRRSRAQPIGPITVRAHARYVRSSARKARLVCDHIRGKSVPEARALLAFAPRGVAKDWTKLLNSAIANAENNHELVADELHVTVVYADEGPTLKRFRPRAMGRATPIHKRTSHLTIELGPKE